MSRTPSAMAMTLRTLLAEAEKKQAMRGGLIVMEPSQDDLFFNIKEEDKACWKTFIKRRNAESIQNIVKLKKYHLLTHPIGNPVWVGLLRNDELGFANTLLHYFIAMSWDNKLLNPTNPQFKDENIERQALNYLIEFYELQLKQANQNKKNVAKREASKIAKLSRVSKGIGTLDGQGKTPLLLACKMANEGCALRLLALDIEKATINLADKTDNRTPLHIACILGLKRIADKLIERGAKTDAKDNYGFTPFDYLKNFNGIKYISEVLESVNFFHGSYFRQEDKGVVYNQLMKSNLSLAKILVPTTASIVSSTFSISSSSNATLKVGASADSSTSPVDNGSSNIGMGEMIQNLEELDMKSQKSNNKLK